MIINILKESLSYQGNYSSKRLTVFSVVFVMLALTIYATIKNLAFFSWDILTCWLGFISYNAYEMRKDKQIDKEKKQ